MRDDTLPIDSRTQAIIDGLPPEERTHVHKLLDAAAIQQRQRLEQALEQSIKMVPAPFRRRVQKMLLK